MKGRIGPRPFLMMIAWLLLLLLLFLPHLCLGQEIRFGLPPDDTTKETIQSIITQSHENSQPPEPIKNGHLRKLSSSSSKNLTTASSSTASWWQPQASDGLTWQWQLQGTINTRFSVDMYDIDLFEAPQSVIDELHQQGQVVICYFSAGSYESYRPDWPAFFPFIGNETAYTGSEPPFAGKMAEWDERWLDIRRIDLLAPIMNYRLQLAADKHCDGVEPDNMDAYTNPSETLLPDLTAADQLTYNRWIAQQAHAYGLSVGLKNDVDQLSELAQEFDWALNEQCFQYNECDGYAAFTDRNKAVFGVEYQGSLCRFCRKAHRLNLSWMKKKLSLKAWRRGCDDWLTRAMCLGA